MWYVLKSLNQTRSSVRPLWPLNLVLPLIDTMLQELETGSGLPVSVPCLRSGPQ